MGYSLLEHTQRRDPLPLPPRNQIDDYHHYCPHGTDEVEEVCRHLEVGKVGRRLLG